MYNYYKFKSVVGKERGLKKQNKVTGDCYYYDYFSKSWKISVYEDFENNKEFKSINKDTVIEAGVAL